jgi:hypothetical protein
MARGRDAAVTTVLVGGIILSVKRAQRRGALAKQECSRQNSASAKKLGTGNAGCCGIPLASIEIIRLVETMGRIGDSNVRDILWKQRNNLASNVQHAGDDVQPQDNSLNDSKIELT